MPLSKTMKLRSFLKSILSTIGLCAAPVALAVTKKEPKPIDYRSYISDTIRTNPFNRELSNFEMKRVADHLNTVMNDCHKDIDMVISFSWTELEGEDCGGYFRIMRHPKFDDYDAA